jgi:hypothetical protein
LFSNKYMECDYKYKYKSINKEDYNLFLKQFITDNGTQNINA